MKLKVIEPLNTLFKDEVRRIGKAIGISKDLLMRHPFPGPGLAIRILGDITPEKVSILQEVDDIFISSLKKVIYMTRYGKRELFFYRFNL